MPFYQMTINKLQTVEQCHAACFTSKGVRVDSFTAFGNKQFYSKGCHADCFITIALTEFSNQ